MVPRHRVTHAPAQVDHLEAEAQLVAQRLKKKKTWFSGEGGEGRVFHSPLISPGQFKVSVRRDPRNNNSTNEEPTELGFGA